MADLLDNEFVEACRRKAGKALPLEAIRAKLAAYPGALSDLISDEREER